MRNKSTLFYSVSQVKVLNEIHWQKGPVTFKPCKSLENSTGRGPGGQHYCQTLVKFECILIVLLIPGNFAKLLHKRNLIKSLHADLCQQRMLNNLKAFFIFSGVLRCETIGKCKFDREERSS